SLDRRSAPGTRPSRRRADRAGRWAGVPGPPVSAGLRPARRGDPRRGRRRAVAAAGAGMTRLPYRTRVKFCGLTRAGDVRLAGELGVDAVGFVFAHGSPRRVHVAEARALRAALAPLVDAMAVFRDNSADEVREVVRQVRPSLLQFHGGEDAAFCRRFDLPYVKAVGMGGGEVPPGPALRAAFPDAAAFLFDSHGGGHDGGSGRAFDWAALPAGLSRPWLLSGGLSPRNVHDAIA